MTDYLTPQDLIEASQDAETLEQVVNGNDTTEVTSRLNRTYPTLAKAMRVVVENGLYRSTMYATKTQLDAALSSHADNDYAVVTDDRADGEPTEFNGFWQKQSGTWKYLAWNPLQQFLIKLQEAIAESKQYTDNALLNVQNQNILIDSFNELIEISPTFANWNWLNIGNPIITSDTTYSPLATPKLRSNYGQVDKKYDFTKIYGLKSGDKLTVSALVYFEKLGGMLHIYLRDSNNTILVQSVVESGVIGLQKVNTTVVVPNGNLHHILIRCFYGGETGIVEVSAYAAAKSDIPADFVNLDLPQEYKNTLINMQMISPNLLFDPFNETVDPTSKEDKYQSVANAIFSTVTLPPNVSAFNKPVLTGNANAGIRRYLNSGNLGLKDGDKFRVKIKSKFTGNGSVAIYYRNGSTNIDSQAIGANILTDEVVSKEFTHSDGDRILVALDGNETKHLVALAVGRSENISFDYNGFPLSLITNNTPTTVDITPFVYGNWFLRETRQRLRKLEMSEDTQLSIAAIGDSWTHGRDSWIKPTAEYLMQKFGDAAGGWCGFGFHPTVTSLVNGNVRPSYALSFSKQSDWESTYSSSPSPDICSISTSVIGTKLTLISPASSQVGGCTLFFMGSDNGIIRYRFNENPWVTLSLNAVANSMNFADLTGFSTSNNVLEIEHVSGTSRVCGVDWQSSRRGIVVHKLGATGSQARQWAYYTANAEWDKAFKKLSPNLVTILLGTNDQGANRSVAQFSENCATLIDRVKVNTPLSDILLIMPPENIRTNNSVAMSLYAEAIYKIAKEKRCAFIDLQKVFGDSPDEYSALSERNWFRADEIHVLPETGGRAIIDAVIRFLSYS